MHADANHDGDVGEWRCNDGDMRKKRKRRRKRMVMKMLLNRQVLRQRFEVVVVMEGTSETSNMTFQVALSNSDWICTCTFGTFFIASKQF